VRIKNARTSTIKKIDVEVLSEKAFNLSTHMSEIAGKVRERSLGKKIGHSKEFREVWLVAASRLMRKVIEGRRMVRQIISTGKVESGAATPKE
jgi:hypothetical protein